MNTGKPRERIDGKESTVFTKFTRPVSTAMQAVAAWVVAALATAFAKAPSSALARRLPAFVVCLLGGTLAFASPALAQSSFDPERLVMELITIIGLVVLLVVFVAAVKKGYQGAIVGVFGVLALGGILVALSQEPMQLADFGNWLLDMAFGGGG